MFVVAKVLDKELTQELFDFEGSLYEAYIRHYIWDFSSEFNFETLAELNSIEEVKQSYFDADMMINILQFESTPQK